MDYTVAGFQQHFRAAVQLEINFAADDDVEIYCIGGVHPWTRRFHYLGQSRQFLLHFGEGRHGIHSLDAVAAARGHGKEEEAEAVLGGEVGHRRGRRAVGGELDAGFATPKAVEFESGKRLECERFDSGIAGEDGLALGGLTSDDAADFQWGASSEVVLCRLDRGFALRIKDLGEILITGVPIRARLWLAASVQWRERGAGCSEAH